MHNIDLDLGLNKPGLLKLLLNLNPNKANGPDNVPTKFLKICAHEVVDMYLVLFQASLDQGLVPPDWKEGNKRGTLLPSTKKAIAHSQKIIDPLL